MTHMPAVYSDEKWKLLLLNCSIWAREQLSFEYRITAWPGTLLHMDKATIEPERAGVANIMADSPTIFV
jgi:hypothetical protein